jgi:hypothetical protein
MNRLAIPLALVAVAVTAACAHRAEPAPAPIVVVPQQPPAVVAAPAAPTVVVPQATVATLRPGAGRIETIAAVPSTSGAGSTAASSARRISVRMQDGTLQYVDTEAPNLSVGDRVELTSEGYIRHPVP